MPLYLFHGKVNQMALLERSLGKPMEGDGLKVVDPFLGEEILIYVLMEELELQAGFNSGSDFEFIEFYQANLIPLKSIGTGPYILNRPLGDTVTRVP